MSTAVQHATNGDVQIAYEVAGDGPPLILLMGLGYDRHGWGVVPRLLAVDFQVAWYDNRGIGESDVPTGPYSAALMAEDALAVMDAAGFERAHVLGTSLGGMVAQELVLAHPERVEKLVLACTTPGGPDQVPMPQRSVEAIARFPLLPAEEGYRLVVENALSDESVASRPELVEELVAYRLSHQPPMDGWLAQAAAGMTFDSGGRLGQIAAPTLVQHGTGDHVVDYRNSQLIADAIPGARIEIFEGLGHLYFWEEPERFVSSVREFLL
jgi:pimeloyl-ACP methyl ester carboxylesterase